MTNTMDEALFGEPVYGLKELPAAVLIKNFSGYWGYAVKAGIRRIDKREFIRIGNLIMPGVSEALPPGGAVFFMNDEGLVDHTGLYLGNRELLHATRGRGASIQPKNGS